MSRKTEEIKLRVTTLEKGWWQEAALSENTTVSELIRRVMNERVSQVRQPQANAFDTATVTLNGADVVPIPILPDAAPQPDRVRRETSCPCGKPPWLYCGGCDV